MNAPLYNLVDALSDMEDGLAETVTGSCARLEVGPPTPQACGPDMGAISYAALYENGELVSNGSVTLTAHPTQGTGDLVVQLSEGGFRDWTLTQTVRLEGGAVRLWGTIERTQVLQVPTIRSGGWSYSAGGGAQEDPDSEPGFHDDAALMFRCTAGGAAAAAFNLADLLTLIANIIQMAINYVLDLFIPYTPPLPGTCTGPSISDGAGQSCENVDIPCADGLAEMCESVGDIPGVSVAFKKCMKGRCGCGGSRHPRANVSCAGVYTCGPCTDPLGAWGCNLLGSQIWYCNPNANMCDCVETIFHEMSHACGQPDQPGRVCPPTSGNPIGACRIGMWFEDQCRAR